MEQPIEGSEQASWWPEDSGQKMEMGKRVKEKRNRGGFLQKNKHNEEVWISGEPLKK